MIRIARTRTKHRSECSHPGASGVVPREDALDASRRLRTRSRARDARVRRAWRCTRRCGLEPRSRARVAECGARMNEESFEGRLRQTTLTRSPCRPSNRREARPDRPPEAHHRLVSRHRLISPRPSRALWLARPRREPRASFSPRRRRASAARLTDLIAGPRRSRSSTPADA